MSIKSGTVLSERYRIRHRIGSGGMANVYLAEDMRNGKPVAIKVLKRELNDDREFVRRFETEALAASSLSHENIVKVLGVGEAQGYRYMVQEFVDGISLKDMISHYGRLDWRIAVPMFIQIAMALANAHDGGIIHRDIKPHNIMITRDHKAMVTDFGIARATTATAVTQTGSSTLGSVHYFSPEQAKGAQVSAKSDIYMLGTLMYETLTGQVPFDGDAAVSIAIKHLQETPKDPNEMEPTIPQGLSDIVMRCMRKSPAERYRDARDLVRELDAFMINPQGVYGTGRQQDAFETTDGTGFIEMDEPGSSYEKIRDFEQVVMERRSSRRRESGVVIAIILLAAALVTGGVVYFVDKMNKQLNPPGRQNTARSYTMTNFIGESFERTKELLDEFDVPYNVVYQASPQHAAGIVLDQSIKDGETYTPSKMTELILTVSSGPEGEEAGTSAGGAENRGEPLKMPDGRGKDFKLVKDALEAAGLIVEEVKEEETSSYAPGTVSRHAPEAGAVVYAGDTVRVYVVARPSNLTIPQVWGYPEEEIVAQMSESGFVIGSIVIPEGDVAPYFVRWVEDANGNILYAGTSISADTPVNLIVGDAGTVWGTGEETAVPPAAEETNAPQETGGQTPAADDSANEGDN